jgi:gamma-glutamyltranspeptidase/glutathione hydrolase
MRAGLLLALSLTCASCDTLSNMTDKVFGSSAPPEGQVGYIQGFLGGVAADEPRAALVARDVLSAGGNAADAATALGFALAVTLPSRAGLGGGGACLAYNPDAKSPGAGAPEAVIFTPIAPSSLGPNADRPAAVPTLARGLYLLQARYGHRPFESLIAPAEALARFGTPTSKALAGDIALVSGPLFADPAARAVFSRGGVPLTDGQQLLQPELGATLAQIRVAGVGDFHLGTLARRLVQGSAAAGGPISLADLRDALPRFEPAIVLPNRNDKVAFLPPPADGGLAAAAGFMTLQHDPSAFGSAAARALAVAARWREGGGDPQALLTATDLQEVALPALPASTSFVTIDKDGGAVACALSMGNLFGTGRIVQGMGFLLAASPASVPPPLYAAAIAWNDHAHEFRAAVSGSGLAGAPMAVAVGMINALRTNRAMAQPVPDPGRANVIECSRYLPGENGSCAWATDPREPGLAVGGG